MKVPLIIIVAKHFVKNDNLKKKLFQIKIDVTMC